ncbi:hypothetical protein [Streptomyces sp. NPDC047990]|uniref:hypothetical protein n=1 Tax=Streptomyces sp. NPDC047990 TaxID=3365496 RepID=UPI003716A896
MTQDPIPLVVSFLRTQAGIPADAVTGTLDDRSVGDTTIYVFHSGGFRMVRDRMDRADILYDVYGKDRESAAALAYQVRARLLEDMRETVVSGHAILDVTETSSPRWNPDQQSDEPAFTGEVAIFYTAA